MRERGPQAAVAPARAGRKVTEASWEKPISDLSGTLDPPQYLRGFSKWFEDRVASVVILFLLAPVLALIALAVKLESKGPVLFVQERYGFKNRIIRVYKFRTMYSENCDQSGARRTVSDDPRVTPLGRFLRMLSLDELPQLFNVLAGEMSLVGPRAHAVAMKVGDRPYHDAVADYFLRHSVRPGITGWAQVNGSRGEVDSLEKARERLAFDLHYVDNWSLGLELKILLLTVRTVLSCKNAY
jgi:polysaccharide biosynthesis protein PslA